MGSDGGVHRCQKRDKVWTRLQLWFLDEWWARCISSMPAVCSCKCWQWAVFLVWTDLCQFLKAEVVLEWIFTLRKGSPQFKRSKDCKQLLQHLYLQSSLIPDQDAHDILSHHHQYSASCLFLLWNGISGTTGSVQKKSKGEQHRE